VSHTKKTDPYWVKVCEIDGSKKEVFHISSCDGSCGVEYMTAQEYKRFTSSTKRHFICGAYPKWREAKAQKIYSNGTRGKWGVKVYNRRERAKVRTILARIKNGEDVEDPEPYRGRNRNKWDMS